MKVQITIFCLLTVAVLSLFQLVSQQTTLSAAPDEGTKSSKTEPRRKIRIERSQAQPKRRSHSSQMEPRIPPASILLKQIQQEAARAKLPELNLFAIDVTSREVILVSHEPDKKLSYCGTPRWALGGNQIVFDATPGRNWTETRLMSIRQSNTGVETIDLGAGNCPTLSPDGEQLAFHLNGGAVPGAASGIWIMDADGLNRRRLGGFGIPLFSPSGKKLLVSSFSSRRQLSLLDPQTGKSTRIEVPGYKIYSQTSWGSDDETLVAVVVSKQGTGIAMLDISQPDNATVRQVLWRRGDQFDVDPGCPVYSEKTGTCVFTGRTPEGTALYAINLTKLGPPRRLEPGQQDQKLLSLSMSPDGRFVLFCSDRPVEED